MNTTNDCMSPDHVLLATHSDQLSCSKLTVNNQRGTIPVMVAKTKPVIDHFREDRNVWLFLFFLPESKCICAEHDKEEQSCYSGGYQRFLGTNPLGLVQ